jgi:hypothetical protein
VSGMTVYGGHTTLLQQCSMTTVHGIHASRITMDHGHATHAALGVNIGRLRQP